MIPSVVEKRGDKLNRRCGLASDRNSNRGRSGLRNDKLARRFSQPCFDTNKDFAPDSNVDSYSNLDVDPGPDSDNNFYPDTYSYSDTLNNRSVCGGDSLRRFLLPFRQWN